MLPNDTLLLPNEVADKAEDEEEDNDVGGAFVVVAPGDMYLFGAEVIRQIVSTLAACKISRSTRVTISIPIHQTCLSHLSDLCGGSDSSNTKTIHTHNHRCR